MQFKKYLLILFLGLSTTILPAQDLHFTYFQMAPLQLNPALTGAFSGSYRLGGIFREQYASVTGRPYRTIDAHVDAPIIRGIREQDWIGVGIGFDTDKAGNFGLKRSYFKISLAYHLSFNKDQTSILSIGGQYNTASISAEMVSDSPFSIMNPMEDDMDLSSFNGSITGMDPEVSNPFKDWEIGVMFNSRGKKGTDFKLGISGANIFSPNTAFSGIYESDLRLTFFGEYRAPMGKKMSFEPAAVLRFQGSATEIIANALFGYKVSAEKDLTLQAGPGFRLGEGVEFLVGGYYKSFRFGVSYDMNLNGLTPASGTVGGFEVALGYIGTIFKQPDPKPVIFCPRL